MAEDNQQPSQDAADIRVRLIDNGLLIKTGPGWIYCADEQSLFSNISARIAALKKRRTVVR